MKKILASLLVLALCAPAMADVAITAVANGSAVEISIAVSGGAVVRGLALTLDAGAGMTVDPSSASAVNADFNAYIDYYQANGVTELPGGSAHPLATVGAPGPLTGAVEDAVLCLGVLDQTGAQKGYGSDGDASGPLATIAYTGSGDVCLSEDMFRGGIVGDNLGTVSVQVECVTVGAAECKGDGNGDGAINGADVPGLIATFNLILGQPGYDGVYDFNGDDAVNGADIPGFIAVFNTLCP